MNTVRYYFAATVAFLVVAIACSAADVVFCYNSSSVPSGGGVASGQNGNRTFHTVEVIGGGKCDDNQTALLVRKCCPPGQSYDPEVRFCGPAGAGDDEYLRRMMQQLWDGFRVVADAVVVGYDYEQPKCDATQLLVDVPAMEVRGLMEADPSAIVLPPGYCFDLTPSDELVARTCRPRDLYCGQNGYTCVNKCCERDEMYVFDDDGWKCNQSEKPFTMFAYETDADGRPMGRSNSTVLTYNVNFQCSTKRMVKDGFMLTTDGSLYLTGDGKSVPDVGYCVEYSAEAGAQVAAVLQALVCGDDTSSGSWFKLLILANDLASIVCLSLTLLVYNTLPSLQNSRNYYITPYITCELVSFICAVIKKLTNCIQGHTCVVYGYFQFFTYLASFSWLNVICYDIYWMLSWGFSSVWVCTGYLFQHSQHETLQKLSPDIGGPFCWFKEKTRYGILIFYLIPSSVLLTSNLIICFLTAIHFLRIKSELNGFKGSDSKTDIFLVYKEKFVMSTKLFLIMGTSYFFWIICSLFQNEVGIIYKISYIMTTLQGVTIFIIFVAKRTVIMDIRKKFRGSMHHSESTQINTISGSS